MLGGTGEEVDETAAVGFSGGVDTTVVDAVMHSHVVEEVGDELEIIDAFCCVWCSFPSSFTIFVLSAVGKDGDHIRVDGGVVEARYFGLVEEVSIMTVEG